MTDRVKELMELLSDEKFANEVVTESIEETQTNLKAKGYDYTVDELFALAECVSVSEGEISEKQLENVSGGYFRPISPRAIGKIVSWVINRLKRQFS